VHSFSNQFFFWNDSYVVASISMTTWSISSYAWHEKHKIHNICIHQLEAFTIQHFKTFLLFLQHQGVTWQQQLDVVSNHLWCFCWYEIMVIDSSSMLALIKIYIWMFLIYTYFSTINAWTSFGFLHQQKMTFLDLPHKTNLENLPNLIFLAHIVVIQID
jgi:hypothetical protein